MSDGRFSGHLSLYFQVSASTHRLFISTRRCRLLRAAVSFPFVLEMASLSAHSYAGRAAERHGLIARAPRRDIVSFSSRLAFYCSTLCAPVENDLLFMNWCRVVYGS